MPERGLPAACACSSPAAPGFIGSHFVRRLAARRRRGRRARQAHLRRQPREPRRRRRTSSTTATSPTPTRSQRRPGCDAIVNFAAETHVDRSILGAPSSSAPSSRHTGAARDAREHGIRFVQVSTDEVYGDIARAAAVREDDPLRPSSPYRRRKAARRPAGPRVRPHVRRRRVDHARLEHLRPAPVPREDAAALRHERARRPAAAGLRRRPAAARLAARRRPLRRRSSSCCARAAPARSTTSAARSARTSTSRAAILDLTGAEPRPRPPRRRPSRPRPPLLARHDEAARRSAGRRSTRSRRRSAETVEWYRETATGGSRSSRASTRVLRSASTPRRLASEPLRTGCYRGPVLRRALLSISLALLGSRRVASARSSPTTRSRRGRCDSGDVDDRDGHRSPGDHGRRRHDDPSVTTTGRRRPPPRSTTATTTTRPRPRRRRSPRRLRRARSSSPGTAGGTASG